MSKVIFDPTSEEAKALIGKEVEASPYWDMTENVFGKLDILSRKSTPFHVDNENGSFWARFIRALPEPTYAERQAKWVEENGVMVGTRVRVRTPKDKKTSLFEGSSGFVSSIRDSSVLVDLGTCGGYFDYNELELVRETYRPYTDEEMKRLCGRVLVGKDGCTILVTNVGYSFNRITALVGNVYYSADSLLESDLTIDGHKCGVLV